VATATGKQSAKSKVIIDVLRSFRRRFSPETLEKISREYQANPVTIPKALQYVQDGLGVIAGKTTAAPFL
jgi:hypothetical protein